MVGAIKEAASVVDLFFSKFLKWLAASVLVFLIMDLV